jgi:large subunit ribosomal protein L15
MELHDLKPTPGSIRTAKRKGQGIGSGNGKTAGAGTRARSQDLAEPRARASKAVR